MTLPLFGIGGHLPLYSLNSLAREYATHRAVCPATPAAWRTHSLVGRAHSNCLGAQALPHTHCYYSLNGIARYGAWPAKLLAFALSPPEPNLGALAYLFAFLFGKGKPPPHI